MAGPINRKNVFWRESFVSDDIRFRFASRVNVVFLSILVLMSGAVLCRSAWSQDEAFHFDPHTKIFRIDTRQITYAFGVDEIGRLQSIYWGAAISPTDPLSMAPPKRDWPPFETDTDLLPQEFGGWGGGMYVEPALKVTFPDGNRDLDLHYLSHTVRSTALSVLLKDIDQQLYVTLYYTVDPETGVIGRSAKIENKTGTPIMVEQASAGTVTLPPGDHFRLNDLTGRWADEFTLQQQEITPAKIVLESRRGSTGNQNSPWFAIERDGSKDEEHGDVWFGALAWSGSWSMTIEQDVLHRVRVTAGFNAFDFGYKLAPGESLETPTLYAGFTKDGTGGASRLMHRFELKHILPQAPKPRVRPVLYNSWEATTYHVDEAGQESLAERAAAIGVERFVMDDGWFGKRTNQTAGLGDWYPNPQHFPHGLKPLIDKVHSLGMDFGLWVEPEMVNPDSDLYRQHPDWILNFPGRPRTESKDQFVLNLARPDVRQYVFNFLDKLLSENDIAFLKWDYNRNWSEPGWPAVAPDMEKRVYVTYIENFYGILRELRAKHPKLEIESCSGGGGRVDLGIMGLTDEIWTSDNTDAFDRLLIQDGFSRAYTPGAMMAWVTDSPNWINNRTTSLDYRFLVAMQGSLGIGADLSKWSPQEMATAKQYTATYKEIREVVQHGSLYRLISSQHDSEDAATESVSLDRSQAVLFTFLHSSQETMPYPTVRLLGLDPDRQYRLHAIAGAQSSAPAVASGRYWMEHGIAPSLSGDFKAAAFLFTAASQ
jgi:alpha-galactosidase